MSKKPSQPRPVVPYEHTDKTRPNNPPVGLVDKDNDPVAPKKKYEFDPHLAPALQWAGRVERDSFEVPTLSLHVHERIDPRTLLEAVRKRDGEPDELPRQPGLFDKVIPTREAIEFYKHAHGWSNRIVAGDSLLAMNSLLEKESLGGQVQMVYFDPPYGIAYGSNFQPFITTRSVGDTDRDLTQQPETVRAFRDTWANEIHSYISYLRERFLLVHRLLHESGSLFVQINDENLPYVRILLDEIFGRDCRVVTIPVKKKGNQKSKLLDPVNDYLVWYSRSPRESGKVKFHRLFEKVPVDRETVTRFKYVDLPDGSTHLVSEVPVDGKKVDFRTDPANLFKRVPGARLWYDDNITNGGSRPNQQDPIELEGKAYNPPVGRCWSHTTREADGSTPGMLRVMWAGRLWAAVDKIRCKRYLDDFGYKELTNWWDGLGGAADPLYVVQTNEEIIKRCILMTTDPGDIVLDPTCGSGTTPYVAEQWGRRWIACDTSRVSVALTRQRLMTSVFDWYQLADSTRGIAGNFAYETAPHVTLGSIANNPRIDKPGMSRATLDTMIKKWAPRETLFDRPIKDAKKCRVSGPFTVEALPSAVQVMPLPGSDTAAVVDDDPPPPDKSLGRMGETARQANLRDELLKTGVIGRDGNRMRFLRVAPMPATHWLHADADLVEPLSEGASRRVVVTFGPEHEPLDQVQVEQAIEEARTLVPKPALLLFAAYQFDPEAAKDIDETKPQYVGMQLLKVQMNPDMLTEDLKKKRASNESFWLVGQPEVDVTQSKDGRWVVEVKGFDYFDTRTGELDSGNQDRIAFWALDTDYDGRSLFPRQFFYGTKRAKKDLEAMGEALDDEIDHELLAKYLGTVSLPFRSGARRRIAVKVLDDRGIESLVVRHLPK